MSLDAFGAITVDTVANQAYQAVKRAILQGQLRPGDQINEVQLADLLRISRTPLREAIRRLEAEGFLNRDRGALNVPSLSLRELVQLYDIRARLEGLAAGLAASRISDSELEALRAANRNIRRAEQRSPDDVLLAGTEFHRQIAALADNPKNLEFLGNVMAHLARYRVYSIEGGRASLPEDHGEVLDALASHDAARAEALMVQHINHARDIVCERLRNWLEEGGPQPT